LRIRLATRGSRLAIVQTEEVEGMLRALGHTTEKVVVKSHGDVDRTTPLYRMGVKGIFEAEVDRAVLEGEADIAVHSLKDVPYELPSGLILAAVPKRGPAYDAILPRPLYLLSAGSRVGTGSIRRMFTVKALRGDLEVVNVRGNVDTRIKKLGEGQFDALITAEVALKRLGVDGWFRLNPRFFVPSPGQGALAVTCRVDAPKELVEALRKIDHAPSRVEVSAEREIASAIGGGCSAPVGVYVRHASPSKLVARVSLAKASGGLLRLKVYGSSRSIVRSMLRTFEGAGGFEEARRWRERSVLAP